MSRQDKATTERHARTLRDLVKRPENKVCSDCKHNDPRWASWNLGVFLCIRCSGIHRGMGTHISKVKSIDLDTWTPEQMESITKWGNHRANLYWEAHLKPGHIPPDHKMESFIRSKYESRRWAMDGPPPSDPTVLESGATVSPAPSSAQFTPTPASSSSQPAARTLMAGRPASPLTTSASRSGITNRQPQPHQLLSAQHTRNQNAPRSASPTQAQAQLTTQQSAPAPAAAAAPKAPENDLFSLDFHAPPSSASSADGSAAAPRKDVKQDILSLFSTPSPQTQFQPQQQQQQKATFGAFASAPTQASPWGQPQAAVALPPAGAMAAQPPNGAGGQWGVGFGWNAATPAPAAAMPAQQNIWSLTSSASVGGGMGGGMNQQAMFSTSDVWGGSAGGGGGTAGGGDLFGSSDVSTQKKDDVFGDIWGGFK